MRASVNSLLQDSDVQNHLIVQNSARCLVCVQDRRTWSCFLNGNELICLIVLSSKSATRIASARRFRKFLKSFVDRVIRRQKRAKKPKRAHMVPTEMKTSKTFSMICQHSQQASDRRSLLVNVNAAMMMRCGARQMRNCRCCSAGQALVSAEKQSQAGNAQQK